MNSSAPRSYAENELHRLVRDGMLLVETWALVLLQDNAVAQSRLRQQAFLDALYAACEATRSPIWTSALTWGKLQELVNGFDENKRYAADRALDFLSKLDGRGLLNTINKLDAAGGEIEMICETYANRDSRPICVVTQNPSIASAVLSLNGRVRANISVRRVNMNGCLSAFNVEPANAPAHQEYTPNNRWGSERANASNAPARQEYTPSSRQGSERPANASNAPVRQEPSVPPVKPEMTLSRFSTARRSTEAIVSAPGTVLFDRRGNRYKLGTQIDSGAEADVYNVEGMDDIAVKLFRVPTSEAQEQKIALLSTLNIPGCVFPRERLYTARNTFCGFTMEKVDGIKLTTTFDPKWRKQREENFFLEQSFSWNRANYAHAAMKLIAIESELMKHGVYVVDSRLDNVMVAHDVDGFLSADHLMLIDLDSAQVNTELLSGGRERGWIAAGGITPDMSAPELIGKTFTTGTLIDDQALAFQMALQAFTILQVGLHPYHAIRDLDVDPDRSLAGAISNGEFPYGVYGSTSTTTLQAPDTGARLMSYLPGQLKKLLHSTFSYGSRYFNEGTREGLIDELLSQLRYADSFFRDSNRIKQFNEMLTLEPSTSKPFIHACTDPNCSKPHEQKLLIRQPSELTEATVIKVDTDTFLCRECYARRYPKVTLG
jgi:hypothetical protein